MQQTRRGKTFRELVTEAKSRIQELSKEEFQQWLADGKDMMGRKFIILDVREPDNYNAGHIPGALMVPRGVLEVEIDELVPDQDSVVVAYCGGGSRSALAADTLQVMGYENVYSLIGGWKQWNGEPGGACKI